MPVWQQLTVSERQEIEAATQEVQAAINGDDYKVIRKAIEQLDKKTRRFAEIMMDSAVSGALQGKTMSSAGDSLGEAPAAPHPFAKAEVSTTTPLSELQAAEADPETPAESTED
jgi:molecular chaperone DnaK/molecular chaperone HscA